MGIILNGILGKVSGKVAGVVGGSWKDKAYLRAYVKPANPNTALQQVQRTKFSDVVAFCKPLVGQVFNAYTDKFQKTMSGFNFFIKKNIDTFDGTPEYETILLTEGSLHIPVLEGASDQNDHINLSWNVGLGNNGKDDDLVYAACYNSDTGVWYFASGEGARVNGAMSIGIPTGTPSANWKCYLWAGQKVGGILKLISNSSYHIGVEP